MVSASTLITASLGLIGHIYCDQSSLPLGYTTQEVTAPLGYPIEGYDTGATGTGAGTAGGGYYSQYPSAGGQYDYSGLTAFADTDRTGEVITVPVILIAVASALLGALLAPLIAEIGTQLSSIDLDLPGIPGMDNRFIKNRSKHHGSESKSPLMNLVAHGFKKFLKG